MNKEYLERNAKGYEGDTFIHSEIEKLVKVFGVTHIIETGTYKGATAKRLSEFAAVTSIEFDHTNFSDAIRNTSGMNITVMRGDSAKVLRDVQPGENVLYFLDAHWQEAWPLLNELEQIKEIGVKPVIIIHDFKVPGKDFGYDSYANVDLDLNYIQSSLEKIYGAYGYDYHYNEQADGGYRGVIYIYPKKSDLPELKSVYVDPNIFGIVQIQKELNKMGIDGIPIETPEIPSISKIENILPEAPPELKPKRKYTKRK